ncbi:probable quinone oxidoreductase isoform X2 [Fagus crenata]
MGVVVCRALVGLKGGPNNAGGGGLSGGGRGRSHWGGHTKGKVEPGHTILVHAAAGGVGSLLSQWANSLGATVIGTVSTKEKAAQAKDDGCHDVIIYKEEDFVARVNEITSGNGVDVVYDSVGKDTFQAKRTPYGACLIGGLHMAMTTLGDMMGIKSTGFMLATILPPLPPLEILKDTLKSGLRGLLVSSLKFRQHKSIVGGRDLGVVVSNSNSDGKIVLLRSIKEMVVKRINCSYGVLWSRWSSNAVIVTMERKIVPGAVRVNQGQSGSMNIGSLACLKSRGYMVSFGQSSGTPDPLPLSALAVKSLFLTRPSLMQYTATREELLETAGDVFSNVRDGVLRVRVNHTYPLSQAAQAHADLESRKTTGSVVLIP